jgi:hypothetical protein
LGGRDLEDLRKTYLGLEGRCENLILKQGLCGVADIVNIMLGARTSASPSSRCFWISFQIFFAMCNCASGPLKTFLSAKYTNLSSGGFLAIWILIWKERQRASFYSKRIIKHDRMKKQVACEQGRRVEEELTHILGLVHRLVELTCQGDAVAEKRERGNSWLHHVRNGCTSTIMGESGRAAFPEVSPAM